jgi:ketosteroid isomerase-like protein
MKPSLSIFVSADEVESAFYTAFNRCDVEAMAKVWSGEESICVHPGSQAIIGYAAVLRSWAHILTNARLPDIQLHMISRTVSDTIAVHVIEERIETGEQSASVLATNIYRQYDSGWLMIEHHGSVIHRQTESHTLQ